MSDRNLIWLDCLFQLFIELFKYTLVFYSKSVEEPDNPQINNFLKTSNILLYICGL